MSVSCHHHHQSPHTWLPSVSLPSSPPLLLLPTIAASCRKRRFLPSTPPPLPISGFYPADHLIHHKNCAAASSFSIRACCFSDGAAADGFTMSRPHAPALSSSFPSSSAWPLSFMKTYNNTCASLSFSGDMERINTFSPQMSSSSSVMPCPSSHSNKYIIRCRKYHSPLFCAMIGFNHIHDQKGYNNFAPVQIALSSSSSSSSSS